MIMVSIIIPLYNKEKAIRQTLQSVLNQTYRDYEVIVADDGSTDGSGAIVQEVAKEDSRVKYFRKENGGVSSARNFGLSKAQGEWVVFLDADDEMLPCNLEILLGLTEKFHVNMAAANVIVSGQNGEKRRVKLRINRATRFDNYIKALIRHQGIFASGASIYKRELLGKNPYNENLSRYEDCEFELNLFVKSPIVFSPEVVMIHHEEFAELSKIRNHNKEKDFIFNMDFHNKTFWQKVRLGQFINEGCYTYEKGTSLLKEKYGSHYYWRFLYLAVSKYYGAIYRIEKAFGSN